MIVTMCVYLVLVIIAMFFLFFQAEDGIRVSHCLLEFRRVLFRSYRARAFGDISQTQLEELAMGIEIDGVRYGKIDANLERRTGRNQWVEMTLTEGKNRE